jgi:hypothetical protein
MLVSASGPQIRAQSEESEESEEEREKKVEIVSNLIRNRAELFDHFVPDFFSIFDLGLCFRRHK